MTDTAGRPVKQGDPAKAWELIEKIGFCMLASRDGDAIRARPMAAFAKRDEGRILFLTDADTHKAEEVAQRPEVCLAFADKESNTYVSVSGTGAVTNDRGKIKELWNVAAKAWWDGPDDPSIRILSVTPDDAEYWDAPGKVFAYAKMAIAAVTSAKPAMGDHAKVAL